MIRTVRIPTGVSRMGCARGGSCCNDCRRTGPPIGPAATHVHSLAGSGRRNAALHSTMGDSPDIISTIYGDSDALPVDTGLDAALQDWANSTLSDADLAALNSARASTSTPYDYGVNPSKTSSAKTWLYVGAGLLAVLLLEAGNQRGSRR